MHHSVVGSLDTTEPAAPPAAAAGTAALHPWPVQLLDRARRWIARSLGRRFVVMSMGLLLVIQLTSFFIIDRSLHSHASGALPQQLAMGARTVQAVAQWRADTLMEGARLLAADYGFRSAVLSNDRATIDSVLTNHGARIGATEVLLLGTDLRMIGHAESGSWDPRSSSALIGRLAQLAGKDGAAAEVAVVGGLARQVVLVPMKAPVLVGWVLIGFAVPDTMADEVHRLSSTNLTLLAREAADQPWQVSLSRLPKAAAQQLAQQRWHRLPPGLQAPEAAMSRVAVDGQAHGVHALWITPASGQQIGVAPEVLALLSVSVDEAVKPPRDLQIALLLTALLGVAAFGLASIYAAERITTPLQLLAGAAERLGNGDYVTPIQQLHAGDASAGLEDGDEVAELAQAFEHMRRSVAHKQEQIVQSEKLASIGQLAAGVAHEINNPIGFVFSNFGTLEEYLARLFKMLAAYQMAERALDGAPVLQHLQRLREEIELEYLQEDIPALMSESKDGITRVRKIVQDLKDFSHADARQEWETVDLHRGLNSTLNIVSNEIKYKAEIVKDYGELPPVECLPGELNQVFMNLMVNASHAIGPQRGKITLRTGVGTGGNANEVFIEVEDTGCGIAPADLKRIFDPFFTTKAVGTGTGLGLSLSYGIVKKHSGRIEVHSKVGVGTRFRVWIPTVRTLPAAEPKPD